MSMQQLEGAMAPRGSMRTGLFRRTSQRRFSPGRALLPALLPAFFACSDTGDHGTRGTGDLPLDTECPQAEDLLGYPACVHHVPDEDTFQAVTVDSSSVDQLRVGKYMVPATQDARLPTLFIYVDTFPLHYDFLVTAFPDLFSGLTTSEYNQIILYPESREFYAGTLSLYVDGDGFYYGFVVWDDPSDESSTLTLEQATAAWEALQERFGIGDLAWVPYTSAQAEAAQGWDDAPFTIEGLDSVVEYEVYNPGECYGSMRLYTLDEFDAATEAAEFGYQDILAIAEAPYDIERVVSGIVTGTRQGTLSHLNVRSLARGTPNCYMADPLENLAAWEGMMVRFECGQDDWSIREASTQEAESWWESIQPDPVDICEPDLDETSMPGLLELATDTSQQRETATCQYGSKGANLATLYQRIDQQYQLDGFLVPFHYYDQFVRSNTWTVDLGRGAAEYSFQDTLEAWHQDEYFLGDPSVRRDRLESLRQAMDDSPVDQDLLDSLGERILDVFGSDTIMVRFRSSSNAEDSLEFSGAGLYESESACLADETDGDDQGPSLCDSDKDNEETLQDALREVWASLWNMEAWDERDWYGIDHMNAAMGVLVNTRTKNEQANIVAFSGNPTSDDDDRYLVNSQEGELDVVSSEPGIYPESDLLTLEDGQVIEILRVSSSSELSDGDYVLSDTELEELGEVLYGINAVYPVDQDVPDGYDILWDTEWKVKEDGQLIIKQIRPYLR